MARARAARGRARHLDGKPDGRLAQSVLIGQESAEGFQEVLEEHRAHFGGLRGVEGAMLEDAASLWWRMRRARAVETEWLEQELEQQDAGDERTRIANAFAKLTDSSKLLRLRRYESGVQDMYLQSMKALRSLQCRGWA